MAGAWPERRRDGKWRRRATAETTMCKCDGAKGKLMRARAIGRLSELTETTRRWRRCRSRAGDEDQRRRRKRYRGELHLSKEDGRKK